MNQQVRDKLAEFRASFQGVAVEVLDCGSTVLVACVPYPRDATSALPPGNDGGAWVEVCEPFFMLVGPERKQRRAPALRVVGIED